MNSAQVSQVNLPDSFFDLNTNDLKVLLKDLRAQAAGSSEEPLKTLDMRQLEESKDQLDKLHRFKTTIIRIQFPDRHVLQGSFVPTDTIETVKNFIRPYLASAEEDFVLCKFFFLPFRPYYVLSSVSIYSYHSSENDLIE